MSVTLLTWVIGLKKKKLPCFIEVLCKEKGIQGTYVIKQTQLKYTKIKFSKSVIHQSLIPCKCHVFMKGLRRT